MIDRSFIGVVSEPRSIEVENGQLRFFSKATQETNPVYFDLETARAEGHPGLPAPPTFLFSLALGAPALRGDVLGEMGVDMRHILHGEQSFTYHQQIYGGDRITMTTTTTDIYDKKNGALEFVVQETRAVNQNEMLCGTMRVVTVVRHG